MRTGGLIYYMHDGPKEFRFALSGRLAGVDANRMDQAWQTASSTIGRRILSVDVTLLTAIDETGRDLLVRWHRAGAHYIANSPASRSLVESITKHALGVRETKTQKLTNPGQPKVTENASQLQKQKG